ncbi:MAG: tRNA pseudouridine(13) synthase TruD [Methanocorpusculum sp.]|nr:tRNA pseudouridine(13) synthase TruD [Methanocorpusculum sp.]
MKRSEYKLENMLGMNYYSSDADGIGGKLRSVPEDFIVEEIPVNFTNTGPYTLCKFIKKSWEHQHAMREITNRLKISQKRIGWAGTKDRNAVTTQYISLYDVSADAVKALSIKDMEIIPVASHQFPLSLGNLLGNKFQITIRGCNPNNLCENVASVTKDIASGIPNYYGIQRFGAMKPVTHKMGYHILRGEYKEAVDLYVGDAFPYESDEIKKIRSDFRETGDAKRALFELPVHLSYERIMLNSLMSDRENYAAALQSLPPKLLSMFVSAYQSWLFNLAVSARCEKELLLNEPETGDHLIFSNGRIDTVTDKNLPTARQHIKRNRCCIVAWMPGKTMPVTPGFLENVMLEQMKSDEITAESFASAADFVKINFDGNKRRISLSEEVSADVSKDTVILKFELPPGHYATTVAREYMKAEPEQMV